ncbi:MAG TPA: serine hydrolase domain-containing protein [Ramlibacter sp.]|nr:serine hydrolase domain-containing protein [Ramlibacter sp.]
MSKGGVEFPVHGQCAPGFEAVRDAFEENFVAEDEIGASVSVVLDGRKVVDLWGGWRDAACTQAWERDTIVCMMSVSKGVSATCLHMLIDRGLVDLDAPVARYWPEFAQAGKERVLVRHVLDHRAGLPILTEPLHPQAMFDHALMVQALARQAPLWEPGTQAGYHVHNQGFLIDEIVRRVTGRTLPQFLREEVTGPLGLDFQFGLPAADQARCADFIQATEGTIFAARNGDPGKIVSRAWDQLPDPLDLNSRQWREATITSASGHGNARAVARLYGALARGGELDGVRLMSTKTRDQAIAEQHNLVEVMMERPYHQALGYLLTSPPIVWMGPGPRSFGHHGVGGSIGLGDPDAKLGFAYAINKMHARPDNGPRARRLIEAVYRCMS